MATGNFDKKLYNALVHRPILLHLIIILKLTHLHNRYILALQLVKVHQKTEDQPKLFDERIINCTYTIQEHLLGIAVCSLIQKA